MLSDPKALGGKAVAAPLDALGRGGRNGEAVVFLASRADDVITGVTRPVDGGDSIS